MPTRRVIPRCIRQARSDVGSTLRNRWFARLSAGASRIRTLGPTPSLGPATWVELVPLAARDRTDAAIAKPEPPFVRVDELGGQFPGMPGAPSHGQNRGLAVGAADHAPRACDSAHGLTGRERAISRLAAPGSRVPSEPDPTTVSRSAPFIRSEPCVCRRVRGWDLEILWGRRRGNGTIVAVAN